MNRSRNIFLSERFILLVIIINSIVLFVQESGNASIFINSLDILCTVVFMIEMICKHHLLGVRGYWKDGWNIMDGTLVLISIPSLILFFIPKINVDLSILLILRVLRVFRFLRVVHIFPNLGPLIKSLWKALRDSMPIFVGFFVLIIICALFSCALFKGIAPQYFGTPLDSIYSTFRLCTVEGWYDIPDALSQHMSTTGVAWVRAYFIIILIAGGIIGLSLVNSVFVDAMVSDNNDELEREVKELSDKIDVLTKEIKSLHTND